MWQLNSASTSTAILASRSVRSWPLSGGEVAVLPCQRIEAQLAPAMLSPRICTQRSVNNLKPDSRDGEIAAFSKGRINMTISNEREKRNEVESDGLDNFSPEQIGRKPGAFGGARLLKFVDGHFVTREGEEIGPDKELVVLGLNKVVQKFVGRKLLDTIIVPDGENVPNLKEMNDAAPREEWGVDLNNNPVGPYTLVLVLKLINGLTLDRFAFITTSVGGSIAIGDLSDKTRIMRRFRGPNVSPVVSLGVTTFRTSFGPKKRPDFRIVRWTRLSPEWLPGPDRRPPPPTPAIGRHEPVATATIAPVDQPAPAPAAATADVPAAAAQSAPALAAAGREEVTLGTPVDPPTLKEEMKDDLPF